MDQSLEKPLSKEVGPQSNKYDRWWKNPWFVILLILGSGFFLFLLMIVAAFVGLAESAEGVSSRNSFTEQWVSGKGETKIVRINLTGIIMEGARSPFASGVVSADRVIEQLHTAGSDLDVAAVLIRVNSPGGGVTASDRIHREIEKLCKKKTTVILMGDTAASGGYYVSVAADRIFAHPTTVTGSIGVIVNSINVYELFQRFGLKSVVIKSSKFKDMMSPFKPIEEMAEDKQVLEKIVMTLYNRFVRLVSKGRNLPFDRVMELADGRVYDAQTALDKKLIDAIGYQDDVLVWLSDKLGKKEFQVVEYVHSGGLFSRMFFEGLGIDNQSIRLDKTLPYWELRSRPAYLWLPGL